MTSPAGELVFREVCKAEVLREAIAALPDGVLCELLAWLEAKDPGEMSDEVWAVATNEAKERFMKGASDK